NTNHQSYRHYSSSCSQTNTLSLLSSPSSPISIPLKSSSQLTNCNTPEDMAKPLNNSPSKIISLLPSNDHLQTICNSLSAPVDSKYSSCSTMITPTATLISSSTTSSSDHCSGQQLNSVQWTKLSCPPPPPTTSSSSSIATTTNNSLEPLETTYVVNIVRKLLEQHNIGQCIFARHVLSLSQGTVSELLSKPQAWSKLTEKGKESYRKMWSWTNSEESILALKSLSPRKVLSDEPKRSRTPSSSSTSSREHSPINQQSFISSSMFSTFPPSLLMQTTNRLKNDIYSPYNILYPQPENYRNWLMLQEIVRTNAMIKQFKSTDVDENEQENEDDTDENPLDLSMKIDTDQTVINNKQSTIKQNKTILIPLTEQDMMKYRHINTIELVQTINDILRSVSDILARPKQWESLTQKGRESFIRMRLFLDDPNAIKQLVQNVSLILDLSSSLLNETIIINTTTNNNKSKSPSKTNNNQSRPQSTTKSQVPPYELPIIPLPTAIDSGQLSAQVQELLSSYSISQRVFGEVVLNLSQGTVSEILSKPRPWHVLSVKGREPYILMYSWFHDTGNVQKLLALRRTTRTQTTIDNIDIESNNNCSKRLYSFTDDQCRVLQQIFENEPYQNQSKLEQLADELSLSINKISNWFYDARMKTKTHIVSLDIDKLSTSPLNDDDNNNSSTIEPLNSSWFNDSDNTNSPLSLSTSSTNIVSLIDNKKPSESMTTSISSRHFHELDKRYRDLEYANNELKQLNTQLEKDLLSVGGISELFRRGPEGQPSDSSINETGIIKDVLNQSSISSTPFKDSILPSMIPQRDSSSDEALTAIVISQRERFRIRNVELENENVSLKQQINIFQNKMDKLRSDNIKLYEKIKFVQTYLSTRGTDDSIDRYSRGYDASLDPFTNFTKEERQKKYESLKLHEKFALNFGRFILSSHQSRTFFVIYFILVHILIFLSLYKMVHTGSSVRDMLQICFAKFREHMAGAHGGKDFHLDHVHGGAAGVE
ncbi:unnamed protein product, partial [Rotaria sp. Silwood2]